MVGTLEVKLSTIFIIINKGLVLKFSVLSLCLTNFLLCILLVFLQNMKLK